VFAVAKDRQQTSRERIHEAIGCLQRLADAFHVRREQLASTAGLTDHQWSVLEEIATEHFMPSMFAKRRRSSPAAVSKTLRQLVDRGLVEASVDGRDARQRRYGLTAHGQLVMGKLRSERQVAIDQVWADLSVKSLDAFITFGNEITKRLEGYADTVALPGSDAKRFEAAAPAKQRT